MALQSTPYKADISLTDLDRGVYETLRLTVARHPSETEERLAVRLLAYVLWYGEQIAFGRGLSDVDEPALWEKSLDGRVLHWIEVGQPDAERITWCSRRCERFSLLAYGNLRVWQTKVLDSVRSLKNINVAAVPQEPLESLSRDLPRSINWTVMISEGTCSSPTRTASTSCSWSGCRASVDRRRRFLPSSRTSDLMRIEPRPLPETLPDLGDLPPLLARLYAARGVRCAEELDKGLARLIPYQRLKGIEEGVALLVDALEGGQRILIVGDFDADGATASSVGVLALRMLGAAWVDYLVPNRFEYGYGLTPEIVGVALEKRPDLLVTVDNGISSVDGVQAAKAAGLKVLVTDTICLARNCRRRMRSSTPTSRAANSPARPWPGSG